MFNSPETGLIWLSAPVIALAWSTIPTEVVARAWMLFGLILIWNLYVVHSNPGEMLDLEVEIEHGLVEQWGGSCYQVVDQEDNDSDIEELEEKKNVASTAAADAA
ncbi:hypothetical protein BGW39_009595 [Mortierella sp. 14UC]|nr:hypothetical protein BGW39_009595 [Mortierella sp. 14UC]